MMKWLRSILEWVKNLFCKHMRRKISLYIADQLVDLDDQSFILFNYTMDDLSNPTIVKNSFSQQVTLKGTPANNRIFGDAFRTDRRVANMGGETGPDFNPSQKTPFTIYNDMGEILESGYVKLDSISRTGADIQYKVTLYGGLGSFFYALSYDEAGNKRTLADLDYLGTDNPDSELDFIINANSVQAAWDRLYGDTSISAIWSVINFAPAYNGIPEGNFSPNKGLVDPTEVGLQSTIQNYTTKSGYALVNLAESQEEWAVKDLRSYLQRPVLSMKAFWDAICNPANNGGYEVNASILYDEDYFGKYAVQWQWMTLPMIPSIGAKQETGDLSLTLASTASSGNDIGHYNIVGSVPFGTKVKANINCKVRFNITSGADAYQTLSVSGSKREGRNTYGKLSAIFIQVVACGSDDSIIGGSRIKFGGVSVGRYTGKALAEQCGYTPAWNADYERVTIGAVNKISSGVFEIPVEMGFTIEAMDVAYYKVLVSVYPGTSTYTEGGGSSTTEVTFTGDGSVSTPVLYADYETGFTPFSAFIIQGSNANSVMYTSSETLRTGAVVTKAMLLSSSHTPAEYMLSFCKIYGLYFRYDVATRKVTILKRNDLYQDATIDLTRRVDQSKGVSINPMVFNAKWYDFILEGAGGAFYDEYEEVEGIPYGIQRVNTGYDFNADAVNLMDSVVFKNACTILGRSKYYNWIFQGQVFKPSPFIDKGNTYTLWSSDGETLDTDISCPPSTASVTYYNDNPNWPGYDYNVARKLELRSADNKPIDGTDILVFFEGWARYNWFKLTDDVPAMDALNDGTPCWLLGPGPGTGQNALNVPCFQRYGYGAISVIEDSMDFGQPRQYDIPGVRMENDCTIYERGWRKYMADRYDVNTKVMTCRVDFSGIQVSQELLRKFYWYDNSLWVLNKIKNYSLTTYDPVECEFVQVQDKDNYLNGQSY